MADAIVNFLKGEENLKEFARLFVMAVTSNSFILTNLMYFSNQVNPQGEHHLDPVIKFLAQIILTCSVRTPNLLAQTRPYSFNGLNFPRHVFVGMLLP
jgi:hypothetical protein